MNATQIKEPVQKEATAPQVGKLIEQIGNIDRGTIQRLISGMAHDLARADLTRVTRFDLCRFLKVQLPFSTPGQISCPEYLVPVDNKTSLISLLDRVGGDNFRQLEEKEKGPNEASFFLFDSKGYPTLEAIRQQARAYDLKLATAREMASFKIHMKGILPYCPYGVPFLLCGIDEFCPPRFRHLLFFPCSVSSGKMNSLEHECGHNEDYNGERRDGWQESPRIYLVRRMTSGEIRARVNL